MPTTVTAKATIKKINEFNQIDVKDVHLDYFLRARRYLALTVALVVVIAGLAAFLLLQEVPQVIDLWGRLQTEQKNSTALQQKAAALQSSAAIDQIDNYHKIDTLLPSKKPLLQLLNNIGVAAKSAQVALSQIQTSPGRIATGSAQLQSDVSALTVSTPTSKVNGMDVLDIGVTVDGTLPQINAFVKNIENITPISDITQFQLTQTRGSQQTSQGLIQNVNGYEAKIRVTSYYFTQPISVMIDASLPEVTPSEQQFLNQINAFQFAAEAAQQNIQGGGLNDLFNAPGSVQPTMPSTAPSVAPTTIPTAAPSVAPTIEPSPVSSLAPIPSP
jgi:hypothetical protein